MNTDKRGRSGEMDEFVPEGLAFEALVGCAFCGHGVVDLVVLGGLAA
jgi:hypothetical protein